MKKISYGDKHNISGDLIRQLRQKRRLSQKQLAIKLQVQGVGMEQDWVSRIESGQRIVTDYELRAIALALAVDVNALLPPAGLDSPEI